MSKPSESAAAANKLRLIREGELYRVGVAHAKARVELALRPEALLHGAVEHAVGVAQARFGALLQPGGLGGVSFKTLLPYLVTAGSFILRKKLVKPAVGVGAVVALAAAWLLRHKRAPDTDEQAGPADPA